MALEEEEGEDSDNEGPFRGGGWAGEERFRLLLGKGAERADGGVGPAEVEDFVEALEALAFFEEEDLMEVRRWVSPREKEEEVVEGRT